MAEQHGALPGYKYSRPPGLLQEKIPVLYKFLSSKPEDYRLIKGALGLVVGFGLGVALHYAIIRRMVLPTLLERILSGSFILAFSLGFAVSSQVRCILMLVLPTFFGKSGRTYVGTLAVAYLALGPVTSIVFNGEEITRSMTCGYQLSHNMSRARMKLKLQPLHHVMADLKRQANKLKHLSEDLKKTFKPVKVEVRDDSEVDGLEAKTRQLDSDEGEVNRAETIEDRYKNKADSGTKGDKVEAKYEKKMDFKCEDVFNLAVDGCKSKFHDLMQKCKKKLKILQALVCWPLKLTVLCGLAKIIPQATGTNCDSDEAIDEGFGESFVVADESAQAIEEDFEVDIGYKMMNNPQALIKKTPEEVGMTIKHEFMWRKRWLDFGVAMIRSVLAFLFLRMLYRAYMYNKAYTSDIKHDNSYITGYFKHIDKRRKAQNKRSLLPLRKLERKSLLEPKSPKMTAVEKTKLGKGSARLMIRLFSIGMVIYLDKIIYDILMIINTHSRVEYEQTGVHFINVRVNGSGAMSSLVRSMFQGFTEQNYTLQQETSNIYCLPTPTKTPTSFLIYILVIYIAVWVLVFLEAYGLRFRRIISGFFFPKQEKKRILFLYNSLLQKREGFLRHVISMVRRRAKQYQLEGELSLLKKLVDKYPRYLGCLRRLAKKRMQCLVCKERLGKKGVACDTPGCQFGYCEECWHDIGEVCYACRHEDDWTDTGSSSNFEMD